MDGTAKAIRSLDGTQDSMRPLEVDRQIASLIARLMGHYWAADTPIEIRRELARDWLEDLREFPLAMVENACREWRQTQSRRPTPADIRKLCIAEQIARRPALPAPPRHAEPDEMPVSHAGRVKMGCRLGELAEMIRGERPWPNQ